MSADKKLEALAGAATVILTVAAFALSYAHLAHVAHTYGMGETAGWVWPATVDLFIALGELLVLRAALRKTRDAYAYFLVVAGSLGSVALNVAGVGPGQPVMTYVVAAVPPVAALLAFAALMRSVLRRLSENSEVFSENTPEQWAVLREQQGVPENTDGEQQGVLDAAPGTDAVPELFSGEQVETQVTGLEHPGEHPREQPENSREQQPVPENTPAVSGEQQPVPENTKRSPLAVPENTPAVSGEQQPVPENTKRSPLAVPENGRLSPKDEQDVIENAWFTKQGVRPTARAVNRSPSYVSRKFKELEEASEGVIG